MGCVQMKQKMTTVLIKMLHSLHILHLTTFFFILFDIYIFIFTIGGGNLKKVN